MAITEVTDEEILQIIDFHYKMSYAVSQEPAAQEVKTEEQTTATALFPALQQAMA